MFLLLLFIIPSLFLVSVLVFLATAEGDLTLLLKKHVKREEIEDKANFLDYWCKPRNSFAFWRPLFTDCCAIMLQNKCNNFLFIEGEILAKQLASLGAKLIISARNEAELERVKKQLKGKHAPEVKILPLDLTSSEDMLVEAVQKAESFFPDSGVDYMIHNAAYERPKTSALDATEESTKATFNVNVLGTISLTRLLAASMLKRGRGHFVVVADALVLSSKCYIAKRILKMGVIYTIHMQISSAAGKTPSPGQAVYSASKFALNGYFHSLRSELYQRGIKVTIVCPGPIATYNGTGSGSTERRVSAERCAELTIIAASHGLKEAWISNQPVLAVMYLVQYFPTLGFWLMDKIGGKRLEAAAKKGNTYSWNLLFSNKKRT
ncbi:Short-chain dehydrogenase/reductase SDR [Dillenia turbinata]|uniref:Short-chain dehydrogenase/reductase SDR n=1 Tax=Dillenia turbinata TaxID=194707 RepID=A0AAN8UKL1_9MAGN